MFKNRILYISIVYFILFSFNIFLFQLNIKKPVEVFVQNPAQNGITINPQRVLLPISPTFFGTALVWETHGMEPALGYYNNQEVRYDYGDEVLSLLKELKPKVIRFGGDAFEWQLKKDTLAEIPPTMNPWFSYGMGIKQFTDLVKSLDANPAYWVNMQEGHLIQDKCGHDSVVNTKEYPGTIAETRELAQYLKEKLPNRTIYWNLGGEPWLYLWPKNNPPKCSNWTMEEYTERAKLYADAIKEVFPNAKFLWPIPNWDADWQKSWIDYINAHAGSYIDGISYGHFFLDRPQDNSRITDYLTMGGTVRSSLEKVKNMVRQINHPVDIQVSGFGINCSSVECGTVAHNLAHAQFFKEYIAAGVKSAIYEATIHETNDENLNTWALIQSGGGPIWSRYNHAPKTQPIYYIQKLLSDHTGTEIIESSSSDANIDILTSKKGNTVYLLAINKNNSVKPLPISIPGYTLKNPGRGFVVGTGSNPHNLLDRGATEIRAGYVQVKNNYLDFYAEPYSVSVVEVDFTAAAVQTTSAPSAELYTLYRGWCPGIKEYLLTNDKSELINKKCEEIKIMGKTFKTAISGTEKLQRYRINLGEYYQTAMPEEKQQLKVKYQAKEDRSLGFVYTASQSDTIALYQLWCGDSWLKKHFFTTSEPEKNQAVNSWKCSNPAVAGYLLP